MAGVGVKNIITEEELVSPSWNKNFSDLGKPKLAINSVGGSSCTNIAKRLELVEKEV